LNSKAKKKTMSHGEKLVKLAAEWFSVHKEGDVCYTNLLACPRKTERRERTDDPFLEGGGVSLGSGRSAMEAWELQTTSLQRVLVSLSRIVDRMSGLVAALRGSSLDVGSVRPAMVLGMERLFAAHCKQLYLDVRRCVM
jgi:hypothetical protein